MKENKGLESEVKKKEIEKKISTRKATTKKEGTTKKVSSRTKKTTSGMAKKASTKPTSKASEILKDCEEKETKIEVPKQKKVEMSRQEELVAKSTQIKKEQQKEEKTVEEPKFKQTQKVHKKKKKHTFFKTILILIVIILITFLIHFVRNYMIMDRILAKREVLKEMTNYSYVSNQVKDNIKMEYYHKDKTNIMVHNIGSRKHIVWNNLDTREAIFINPQDLTATIQKNVSEDTQESFHKLMPSGIIISSESSHAIDFLYWITSEKVNGRDCYKITWISGDETAWYNKEDGTLVKLVTMEGKYVVEYSDWKFNQVTDDDITRPNLMGYTVDSNTTEE